MRTLVTGKQMKAVDAHAIGTIGIPSMVLMERAALGVAREVKRILAGAAKTGAAQGAAETGAAQWTAKTGMAQGAAVWSVCGTGNNGADGIAAARMLFLEGVSACVVLMGQPERGTEEFLHQLKIARNLGMEIISWEQWKELDEQGESRGRVLIDAVFGVGLSREVQGAYAECIRRINGLRGDGIIGSVVAVDVPSGIHSDTGRVMGAAVNADVTVTFGWEKRGTVLYPGRDCAGRVLVENIGFPPLSAAEQEAEDGEEGEAIPYACTYGPEDLGRIPRRAAYSNKGTFGKVLIVAGSENMCGAAYLSALAAYRTGAGLVKLLTVEENRLILQSKLPEAILATYTAGQLMEGREEFRKLIDEQCRWADVVVLGPGLGGGAYVEYLVEDILTMACSPVVVDADGLNAIAAHPYLTSYFTENIILTPHLGEMARLTGQTIAEIRENLVETAAEYASHYGLTCVLKDAATVVASREGGIYINTSGSSAMAKAGSGDVLTGIIAGLLGLGLDESESARLGVYLHGLAGELAAERTGSHSMLASDLADAIGGAMGGKTAAAAAGTAKTIG